MDSFSAPSPNDFIFDYTSYWEGRQFNSWIKFLNKCFHFIAPTETMRCNQESKCRNNHIMDPNLAETCSFLQHLHPTNCPSLRKEIGYPLGNFQYDFIRSDFFFSIVIHPAASIYLPSFARLASKPRATKS
jgi:hypothetical protein